MVLSASESCFKNSVILKKIIGKISSHPMENLAIRLVNKKFDEEFLHRMRVFHQKVLIEFDDVEAFVNKVQFYTISVNNYVISNRKARKYFDFLVNVIGVKVKELRGHHMMYVDLEEGKILHEAITEVLIKNQNLRVMTGFEDICQNGCEECARQALQCKEYGPLQFDIISSTFKNKKHFERLILWESFFWDIATRCVEQCESNEECLQMMKSLITPNITCDHLQLQFSDDPSRCVLYKYEDILPTTQTVPREILETICRVWKVKSVGIELDNTVKQLACSSHWTYKQFFTELHFYDPFETTHVSSGIQLDHVELELSRAAYSRESVFGTKRDGDYTFCNLIGNVKRMLPTKRMTVSCLGHWTGHQWTHTTFNQEACEAMIDSVWRSDCQRDSEVTLQFRICLNWESILFDVPRTLYFGDRQIISTIDPSKTQTFLPFSISNRAFHVFQEINHIRQQFTFKDSTERGCLKMDVFLEEYAFKWLQKYHGDAVGMGILKHFS